jgi:hypothetical protein
MENRIQINGIWYVAENEQPKQEPVVNIEPVHFEAAVIESDKYVFESTRLKKEDGSYYKDIDIKFTDKRCEAPWTEEHWDNNNWFRCIHEGDTESLNCIEYICPQGIAEFKAFLDYLIKEEWLCEN